MNHAVVVTFDTRNLWGMLVYATDERGINVVDAISAALLAKQVSVSYELRILHDGRGIAPCEFHSTSVHGISSMEDDLPRVGQLVNVQFNDDAKLLSVWYAEKRG